MAGQSPKVRLLQGWERLRTSFWFVPGLLVALAALLGTALPLLDEGLGDEALAGWGWIYAGGAEGARAVLSVVAGSVITVAGTTFSITIAALTLASSQFGPRLLRNFVRDTGNQVVLGTFIATFLYCLLVLRTVRSLDDVTVVPHISVTVGLGLAIASIGVLIYFIHHVALTIQADHVVSAVGYELLQLVDRAWPPAAPGLPAPAGDAPEGGSRQEALPSPEDGYLQLVDLERLLALATRYDLVIELSCRPGDFVFQGAPLAQVAPRLPSVSAREAIGASFALGKQRTQQQDLRFGIDQLVEIAVRSLSPGINDPFTALACLNRLGAALCRVAPRPEPSAQHRDEAGRVRVVARVERFEQLLEGSFGQIRQYGAGSSAVMERLLEVLSEIALRTREPERHTALRAQAEASLRGSERTLPDPADRARLEARLQQLLHCLEGTGPDRLRRAREAGQAG